MPVIARIEATDAAAVDTAIRSRRPAILTGMLSVWPEAPGGWSEFVARHPDYPLVLSELSAEVPLSRALTDLYDGRVRHLDSLIGHNPGRAYYAMAQPVKTPIDSELRRPEPVSRHCWRTGRTLLYVGSRDSRCHLHVDSDYSHGLHLVVIGHKRVFFVPPEAREKLRPEFNLFSQPFHDWTLEAKRRFVDEAGGAEAEVVAGETFFIPKNWWHQVEYLDHSLGLSWRFARSPAQNVLSLVVKQPISEILQLAETLEEGAGADSSRPWADALLDRLASPGEEGARYEALIGFLERSFLERVPEASRYRSSLRDAEGFEVLRRLAPPKHSRPVLRTAASEAFDFLRAGLPSSELHALAERTRAEEIHDPAGAREAFEAAGWAWPGAGSEELVWFRHLAGLRDHTRFP